MYVFPIKTYSITPFLFSCYTTRILKYLFYIFILLFIYFRFFSERENQLAYWNNTVIKWTNWQNLFVRKKSIRSVLWFLNYMCVYIYLSQVVLLISRWFSIPFVIFFVNSTQLSNERKKTERGKYKKNKNIIPI